MRDLMKGFVERDQQVAAGADVQVARDRVEVTACRRFQVRPVTTELLGVLLPAAVEVRLTRHRANRPLEQPLSELG